MLTHVHQSGSLELIGGTEILAQNDWGAEVELDFANLSQPSGEVLNLALSMSSPGATGDFFIPSGKLAVFRSDPNISVGDADLTTGVHGEAIAILDVVAGDWYSDALGSIQLLTIPVAFPNLDKLFLAFFNTDTTSINSATGDNEVMEVNALFRVDDR